MPGLLLNIDVPDVAAAEAFYCAALGLRPGRRFGTDFVELLGSDAPIYLLLKEAGTAIGPAGGDTRRYARHWSPIHPDFVVEDLDMAVARALAAGPCRRARQARPLMESWQCSPILSVMASA